MYKPRPSPPPPIPLIKKGYRLIEVPGPHFEAGDKLRIKIKEKPGRVFFGGEDEYTVGRVLGNATWPITTSPPLQLYVQGNAPVTIGYVPYKEKKAHIKFHTL